MAAAKYNILIEEGTTFNLPLTFYTDETRSETEDYTGCTWRMHIRKNIESTDAIVTLTSENGKIDASNQANGVINIQLTATETTGLDFEEGVYDLERVDGTLVNRIMEGVVYYSKEVTR